jgi:septal ring factor EnvC (AmiA/AmiB activator)
MNIYVIIAITAIIGGGWFYVKYQTDEYESTIKTQQEQIASLTTEKIELTNSVNVLQTTLKNQQTETNKSIEEIVKLRLADSESKAKLQAVLQQLQDRENQTRLSNMLKSDKQSLVLRLMDLQVKCEMDNFFKNDGKCVRGKWINNGNRVVEEKQ